LLETTHRQLARDRFNTFPDDLFVFCNWRQNIIKILYWDENGFCLWYKRLEEHGFKWPQLPEQVLTLNRKQLNWNLFFDQTGSFSGQGLGWNLTPETCFSSSAGKQFTASGNQQP
jgi:hypothetical protein